MTGIRVATSLDRDDVREIHLCAFPEGEKQIVSTLAVNLLSDETGPQTFSLVAEADGVVVGHSEMGVNVLFVYGDPKYYGKFGFNADLASGYSPPL